ncbi:hypothetical protein P153DRAFT_390427 [Dothidotthia symphoricarpi CBS 119687]|uniref:Uncharacterized protein n=1 Tax=Dothidotthia symphoricarpi CBS 119687 TaxID=1392245 RepID=A0A6A5ZXX7_9PLEO|nr:uncharacterized protein P153DRAFT_390427 [Dothidotthia symphoricarpi CBS 119687]KAF2124389.1 hypothetical protein P153DRAFT_390427 [Dothidotthia symphoricarpi CBS 119687]
MVVRDPNFWHRFSVAAHQDAAAKEEEAQTHTSTWLTSEIKKKRQRAWICGCFWICLLSLVAGLVVAGLVLHRKGIL